MSLSFRLQSLRLEIQRQGVTAAYWDMWDMLKAEGLQKDRYGLFCFLVSQTIKRQIKDLIRKKV